MRVIHPQLLFDDYRDWFYTKEDKNKVQKDYIDGLEVFFGPYDDFKPGFTTTVKPNTSVMVVENVPFCYNKLKFVIDLNSEKEKRIYGFRMASHNAVANKQMLALSPAYYCIITPLLGRKNQMDPIQIIYLNISATVPIKDHRLEEICEMDWNDKKD